MFTTLRSKINAGFAAIIALNVVFGLWSIFRFASIGESTDRILTPNYEAVATAIELMRMVDEQQRLLRLIPTTTKSEHPFQKKWQDEFRNRNAELIALVYESRIDSLEVYEEALRRIRSATQEFNRSTQQFFSGQKTLGQYSDVSSVAMDTIFRAVDQLRRECQSMLTIARKQVAGSRERVQEETRNALFVIILSAMVSLSLAVVSGIFYSRWATRPIQRLNQAVKNLSGGKLGERVLITTADEFGDLTFEFNRMIERLRKYEELNYDQLLVEKQKVEAVVSSIATPVVVVDSSFTMLMLNNAAVDLFRIDNPIQKIGVSLEMIISDHQLQRYIREKLADPSVETNREFPVYIREVEGTEQFYTVQALPLLTTSAVEGIVVVFSDITQFKELDKLKSDFLARVTHELRTPLSSILMSTDILQEKIVGELNEQQADLLRGVKEDCIRLSKLVSNLLEMARLEKRGASRHFSWVQIPEVLAIVQHHHRVQLQEKEIIMKYMTAKNMDKIWMDQNDLLLMLNNLVSNAIRHTSNGGTVSIQAFSNKTDVIIEVNDTGVGIPRDSIDKIFLKFYQVESSVQNKSGSIGLGLAIVREIVSTYHGSISVISEFGKGSTFTLQIPHQDNQLQQS